MAANHEVGAPRASDVISFAVAGFKDNMQHDFIFCQSHWPFITKLAHQGKILEDSVSLTPHWIDPKLCANTTPGTGVASAEEEQASGASF